MAFYKLPTLVCARYRRRALREREAVCRCSGCQMAWSPDPHRIITPLHVIAPAMLSRLRPPVVVVPLFFIGVRPPLVLAFSLKEISLSLSNEIDCPLPPPPLIDPPPRSPPLEVSADPFSAGTVLQLLRSGVRATNPQRLGGCALFSFW